VDLSQKLLQRVQRALGVPVIGARRISRGFSQAGRFVLTLADGGTCFLKQATCPRTAAWLRDEMRVYAALREDFLPRVLCFEDDGERPLLFLEDLSGAAWPPPWTPAQLGRLRVALAALSRTRAPAGVPDLPTVWSGTPGWREVAADPGPLLSLGLCEEGWLRRALPVLLGAADPGLLAGESLVHMDLRGDNLCFAAERTVFVDWNWATRGDPRMDLALLLPSLHADGGPAPEELLPEAAGLSALVSGILAARAGLPEESAPRGVRRERRRQLAVALPWAARTLGLPPPQPVPPQPMPQQPMPAGDAYPDSGHK
jgi:hypothetical protein